MQRGLLAGVAALACLASGSLAAVSTPTGSVAAASSSGAAASSATTAAAAASGADSGTSISTVYFAPVTVTALSSCLKKTSYSFISLHALTAASFSALTPSLTSLTPWLTTTLPGSPPAPTPGISYSQLDVFLTQVPFDVPLNGDEINWGKACYDPRNWACSAGDAFGPGTAGVSCLASFPGAQVQQLTATGPSTVFGPFKNAAAATPRPGGGVAAAAAAMGGLAAVAAAAQGAW